APRNTLRRPRISCAAAFSNASGEGLMSRSDRVSLIVASGYTFTSATARGMSLLVRCQRIEREIELQNIHMRLADEAQESVFDPGNNEVLHLFLGQATRFGDARHLEKGGRWRDVRIEPARGGSHEIDWDRHRWVLRLELAGILAHALDKSLRGRTSIGARGI